MIGLADTMFSLGQVITIGTVIAAIAANFAVVRYKTGKQDEKNKDLEEKLKEAERQLEAAKSTMKIELDRVEHEVDAYKLKFAVLEKDVQILQSTSEKQQKKLTMMPSLEMMKKMMKED